MFVVAFLAVFGFALYNSDVVSSDGFNVTKVFDSSLEYKAGNPTNDNSD